MNIISGQIVDIVKQTIYPGEISFADGQIKEIKKIKSKPAVYLVPGLVDAGLHIESTMVVPARYAQAAAVQGIVGALLDPSWMLNRAGMTGLNYLIDSSKHCPLKFGWLLNKELSAEWQSQLQKRPNFYLTKKGDYLSGGIIDPLQLVKGYLLVEVRKRIEKGEDIFSVLNKVHANVVLDYNLPIGSLQLGDQADWLLVDDLEKFSVKETWIDGEKVAKNGKALFKPQPKKMRLTKTNSPWEINIKSGSTIVALGTTVTADNSVEITSRNQQLINQVKTEINKINGGLIVVDQHGLNGRLRLPVAGLLSTRHPKIVAKIYQRIMTRYQRMS
jgi:adenine deaminase